MPDFWNRSLSNGIVHFFTFIFYSNFSGEILVTPKRKIEKKMSPSVVKFFFGDFQQIEKTFKTNSRKSFFKCCHLAPISTKLFFSGTQRQYLGAFYMQLSGYCW